MKVGDIIEGKYELVRLMGEGGMGAVFECRHKVMGQRFALKCLHPALLTKRDMAVRFIREAQAAAAIGSQHIVFITDAGQTEDGSPFIVMEYLEGEDLEALIKREAPLASRRAIDLMLQVCDALGAAHSKKIVHRDLKPANLFITRGQEGGEWIKVLDFGIAKVHAEISGQSRSMTRTGSTMGTPLYMAPEQFRKTKSVDHRADIYSAGVILYKALSGALPYDADTYEELIVAVAMDEPIPLRRVLPGVERALESVVMQTISCDSSERPQSMAALKEELRPFSSQVSSKPAKVVPAPATLVESAAKARPEGVEPEPEVREIKDVPATAFVEEKQDTEPREELPATAFVEDTQDTEPREELPATAFVEDTQDTEPQEGLPATAYIEEKQNLDTVGGADPVFEGGNGGLSRKLQGAIVLGIVAIAVIVGAVFAFSGDETDSREGAGNDESSAEDVAQRTVSCRFVTDMAPAWLSIDGADYDELPEGGRTVDLALGTHHIEGRYGEHVISRQLEIDSADERPTVTFEFSPLISLEAGVDEPESYADAGPLEDSAPEAGAEPSPDAARRISYWLDNGFVAAGAMENRLRGARILRQDGRYIMRMSQNSCYAACEVTFDDAGNLVRILPGCRRCSLLLSTPIDLTCERQGERIFCTGEGVWAGYRQTFRISRRLAEGE